MSKTTFPPMAPGSSIGVVAAPIAHSNSASLGRLVGDSASFYPIYLGSCQLGLTYYRPQSATLFVESPLAKLPTCGGRRVFRGSAVVDVAKMRKPPPPGVRSHASLVPEV